MVRSPHPCPLVILFGVFSFLIPPAGAQGPDTARLVEAVPRAGEVVIDGRLDEAAWEMAKPARDFIQSEPIEGRPAREDTEVRVLYDEQAIYIGARMYDSEPQGIARVLTRRDEGGRSYDYFEVSLDSNRDRRTAYTFRVTAAGVQVDRYRYDGTRQDDAWQAVWESAVHRDARGWTAELRIPLSQLRYSPSSQPQTWGVNFSRRRIATNETTQFVLESQRTGRGVGVYAPLVGLELTRAARNLELRPYVLAEGRQGPAERDDPFRSREELGARVGGDLRYGLGSTFVLDLTLNPDFGQVEVDPAVINLTAFETFFPERRPFFSRDDRLFDFGLSGPNNSLFYSRRIGRAPQGSAPAVADFADIPGQTPILGAGKVTGRTQGGLTLGVLGALTRRAEASYYQVQTEEFGSVTIEPPSGYGVVRAQQDFRGGDSQVGAILTGTHRSLPADRVLDWLPARAATGGIDLEHTWNDRTWAVSGYLAASRVEGAPQAMTRIQRSPNHYFQRPDADHLELDSDATSLSGAEWRATISRERGENWTGSAWLIQRTPGFEVDDLGFARGGERMGAGTRIRYEDIEPGRILRSYNVTGFFYETWRNSALHGPFDPGAWAHARKDANYNLSSNFTFLNYWSAGLSVRNQPEVLSDVVTRGGPLMVRPASDRISVDASTDPRQPFTLGSSFRYDRGRQGGAAWETGFDLQWRPTTGTRIDLAPRYERGHDPAQYVATASDDTFAATYGQRYLFADLYRTNLSLETRLNVVFSPTMTLQLFAQPMISTGDFATYKQLLRPESFEFAPFAEGRGERTAEGVRCVEGRTCVVDGTRYLDFREDGTADFSFTDRDFNFRSLRGNAVLRWEYRPGSTFYLVWQQNRANRENIGDFVFRRDASALLEAEPDNVLMLKVDYWLGL